MDVFEITGILGWTMRTGEKEICVGIGGEDCKASFVIEDVGLASWLRNNVSPGDVIVAKGIADFPIHVCTSIEKR